jgi:hypothetical protein
MTTRELPWTPQLLFFFYPNLASQDSDDDQGRPWTPTLFFPYPNLAEPIHAPGGPVSRRAGTRSNFSCGFRPVWTRALRGMILVGLEFLGGG